MAICYYSVMLLPILMLAMQISPSSNNNGASLHSHCKAYAAVMDHARVNNQMIFNGGDCAGYIAATADNMLTLHYFCPGSATNSTLVRVYIAYMDKNPKMLEDSRGNGVYDAFRDAYPCPAGK